jgi:hypothetical protein
MKCKTIGDFLSGILEKTAEVEELIPLGHGRFPTRGEMIRKGRPHSRIRSQVW